MTAKNRVIAICLVSLFTSCDYYDDRMHFVNNSSETICLDYSLDTILNDKSENNVEYYLSNKIEPADTFVDILPGSTSKWLRFLQSGKDSTLRIFVFDFNQITRNNWDSLRRNRVYRKFDYPLKKLEECNWIIHIPEGQQTNNY